MIKNVMEAIDLRTTSGKKLEIEPPVNAPSKLAKTSAEEDPKKTANGFCLLYTSPSPRDLSTSRMPSSA